MTSAIILISGSAPGAKNAPDSSERTASSSCARSRFGIIHGELARSANRSSLPPIE
jgi:hypothetical protein